MRVTLANIRIILLIPVLLIFALIAPVSASDTQLISDADSMASWEGKIIEEIRFNQRRPFSEERLQELIAFKSGELFQAGLIRKAVSRLYETGKFKEVWVFVESFDEKRLRLRFHWLESRRLLSVQISGNRHLSDEKILNALGLSPGDRFSEAVWNRGLENLTSLYRELGYFLAKTESQLRSPSDDRQGVNASIQILEGTRARIRKISFLGEKIFSDWMLRFRIYSNKGEFYDGERLKDDLEVLEDFYTNEGYIKADIGPAVIEYDEGTNEVEISLSIQPNQKILLVFEGTKLLSKKALLKQVVIQKERSDAEDVLDESVNRLVAYYRSQGYPLAQVSYTIDEKKDDHKEDHEDKKIAQKTIRFLIKSGAEAQVKKILFSGRYAFSEKLLREQISLRESGFFNKTLYTKAQHQSDAETLRRFYRDAGFQNATVIPVVQFDDSEELAWLLFKIDEGARTRIDQLEFTGNTTLSTLELIKAIDIKSGIPYTKARVQEGIRDLLAAYAEKGYLYAEISRTLRFYGQESDTQRKVVVRYHISEGQQARLGHITLEGNLRTKSHIIERELLIQKGEPYAPRLILESQRAIYQTGLFSSVRFETPDIENTEVSNGQSLVQNVKLLVNERASIAVEFGGGYADRERLRGFFQISHRNLWGSNRQLSLRGEGSNVEERYFLNYKEPWFFDKSIDARITLAYLNLEEVSFNLKTFSGVVGVHKNFSKRLKGSLLYQIEQNEISNVDETSKKAPEDIGLFKIATLNPSLVYDSRDDVFNPSSGTLSSITFRNGANVLGSEIQLLKLIVQSRWYYQLSEKIVFAFSGRSGIAGRFAETTSVPITERFFLGGRNTVRGYEQDELGIVGETLVNGSPTGGNAMLVLNEELRIRLPRSFGMVLFLDHGNVWLNRRQVNPSDIKSSAGVGLRYNTPIGPFRLDWGYKLNREAQEDAWAVHFTLGHAF